MQTKLTSVYVVGQEQALRFSTDVLGIAMLNDTRGNLIQVTRLMR